MLLQPKKAKYRRIMNPPFRGKAGRATQVDFGELGLKAITSGWITARQMEAARRAITHYTKRGGRVWFRIFPDRPVTRKSDVGMGSGKGSVDHYAVPVRAGRVVLEVGGIKEAVAQEALRRASHKLPVRTKIVAAEDWHA